MYSVSHMRRVQSTYTKRFSVDTQGFPVYTQGFPVYTRGFPVYTWGFPVYTQGFPVYTWISCIHPGISCIHSGISCIHLEIRGFPVYTQGMHVYTWGISVYIGGISCSYFSNGHYFLTVFPLIYHDIWGAKCYMNMYLEEALHLYPPENIVFCMKNIWRTLQICRFCPPLVIHCMSKLCSLQVGERSTCTCV